MVNTLNIFKRINTEGNYTLKGLTGLEIEQLRYWKGGLMLTFTRPFLLLDKMAFGNYARVMEYVIIRHIH